MVNPIILVLGSPGNRPPAQLDLLKGACSAASLFFGEEIRTLRPRAGFAVTKDTHWLDILEAFAMQGANVMPVLSEKQTYLGYYELSDVMAIFNDTPFLSEAGGIIVVEKGARDYSFSEICQIIESNEGRVLGVFISRLENDVVQATVKIGHSAMNAIVQTFRRYNYNVISNHQEDKFLDDLKDRSNYLDKYLNI